MNPGLRLNGRAQDLGAIALILLIPSLLFWKVILGDYTNLPANSYWDAVSHLYPLKLLAAEAFRSGEFPLWNPYTYAGTPLLADVQSAPFNPLDLLFYLAPNLRTYSLTLLLYLMAGGVFMYIFMRGIGSKIAGSFTAATIFMLAGYFMFNLEWRKFYGTFLWFPLALLSVERAIGQEQRWYIILGGLALGFSLLAGDLRIAVYLTLGVLFYAALLIAHSRSEARRPTLWKHLGSIAVMTGLGVALACVQLLPAFELLPISSRQYRAPYVGWAYFSPMSFPINSVFPYLFGNESRGAISPALPFIDVSQFPTHPRYYAGLFAPLLALFAVWVRRDFHTKAFFYMAISTLAFLVVIATPIESLLRSLIPGFGAFRHEDALHLFFASEAVLAGLGLDAISSGYSSIQDKLKKAGRALGAFCIASFGFLSLFSLTVRLWPQWLEKMFLEIAKMRHPAGWSALEAQHFEARAQDLVQWLSDHVLFPSPTTLLPIAVLAAGSGAILIFSRRYHGLYLSWAIVGILALDLLYSDFSFLTFRSSSEIYPEGPVVSSLQKETRDNLFRVHSIFPLGNAAGSGPSRAVVVKPSDIAYGHSVLIPYGIYSVDGAESYFLARYVEFAAAADGVSPLELRDTAPFYNYNSSLLDLLNVKYVLSNTEVNNPKFQQVHRGEILAYQNLDALPRAYWVPQAKIMSDPQALLRHLKSPEFDPWKEVIIEEPFDQGLSSAESPSSSVKITSYKLNTVAVRVVSQQPGFLVLADSYYPGWKAFLDGKETKLYRANYLFRAVYVPNGEHEVGFVFRPLSFQIGLAVSLISIGLIVALSGYRISRRFKSKITSERNARN